MQAFGKPFQLGAPQPAAGAAAQQPQQRIAIIRQLGNNPTVGDLRRLQGQRYGHALEAITCVCLQLDPFIRPARRRPPSKVAQLRSPTAIRIASLSLSSTPTRTHARSHTHPHARTHAVLPATRSMRLTRCMSGAAARSRTGCDSAWSSWRASSTRRTSGFFNCKQFQTLTPGASTTLRRERRKLASG